MDSCYPATALWVSQFELDIFNYQQRVFAQHYTEFLFSLLHTLDAMDCCVGQIMILSLFHESNAVQSFASYLSVSSSMVEVVVEIITMVMYPSK